MTNESRWGNQVGGELELGRRVGLLDNFFIRQTVL